MSLVSEIEVVFATGSLKWSRSIYENYCVVYVVFVTEIGEKPICESVISRTNQQLRRVHAREVVIVVSVLTAASSVAKRP